MSEIEYYNCDECDYYTTKRNSYDRHITSWRHLKCINKKSNDENIEDKYIYCSGCDRKFKSASGLYRHKKKCKNEKSQTTITDEYTNNSLTVKNDLNTNEVLMTMMKYLNENSNGNNEQMMVLLKQLEEERKQCKDLMNIVQDMIPRIGNNNNNKQININVFLNEQCKDALNLKDFVESLRIELDDVTQTNYNQKSIVDALGNVFVKGLNQLDLYKRPIHCMDLSREKLFIKDNDKWEHNTNERDILSGAITAVSAKQVNVLQEWERIHPNWNKDEALTNEYLRLVSALTSPIVKGSIDEKKIIHNIAKEVVVDLQSNDDDESNQQNKTKQIKTKQIKTKQIRATN